MLLADDVLARFLLYNSSKYKDFGDTIFIYATQTISYWENNVIKCQPSSCPVMYNVLNIASHIPSCFTNSLLMVYSFVEMIASQDKVVTRFFLDSTKYSLGRVCC
jgi:hypothetical protein